MEEGGISTSLTDKGDEEEEGIEDGDKGDKGADGESEGIEDGEEGIDGGGEGTYDGDEGGESGDEGGVIPPLRIKLTNLRTGTERPPCWDSKLRTYGLSMVFINII